MTFSQADIDTLRLEYMRFIEQGSIPLDEEE